MTQMKKTTIWLEPQDWSMIERLARREGLTRSGVIREAVRRLWAELVPQGEWDLKPTWTLQPLWFELWNDRRNGVAASATAQRLGMSEEELTTAAEVVGRRLAPLPDGPEEAPH